MSDAHDVTIEFPVHFTRGAAGRKEVNAGPEPPAPAPECGRVPRVSRLMALAIRFEELVRCGEVESYADLARLGHVTRARITQVMDLLCLAPDIQEEILFLPRVERDRDAVSEHEVRPVCATADWREQRRRWRTLISQRGPSIHFQDTAVPYESDLTLWVFDSGCRRRAPSSSHHQSR